MGSQVSILLVFFVGTSYSDTLTNCGSDIIPSQSDTVICGGYCNDCNIICNGIEVCKKITVYSTADNTNLYCNEHKSCNDANVYFGNNLGLKTYNYSNIICEGKESCRDMNIVVRGYYDFGGSISLIGNEEKMFKASNLEVDINTDFGYGFNLECGSGNENCNNVEYTCDHANCECDGGHENFSGNCADIVYNNAMTRNPTLWS